MVRSLMLMVILLAVATVAEAQYVRSRGGILMPTSPMVSELSDFQNEFCAPNRIESQITHVCFGRLKVQGALSTRGLVFVGADGRRLLYLEQNPASVELRVLAFEVFGPVGQLSRAEVGQVELSIDARGEVSAVEAWIPAMGRVSTAH